MSAKRSKKASTKPSIPEGYKLLAVLNSSDLAAQMMNPNPAYKDCEVMVALVRKIK